MMWIFEWDIVTGDCAVLDGIYAISRDSSSTGRSPRSPTASAPPTWR